MDAQQLYRAGVTALREQNDAQQAHRLLTQSLRLDPNNPVGWLWLARTYQDYNKQLQCIEQALKVDPDNQMALAARTKVHQQIYSQQDTNNGDRVDVSDARPCRTGGDLSRAEEKRLKVLLNRAQACLEDDDELGALENWVEALTVRCDFMPALEPAVRQLTTLGYMDDVHELLWRAINGGTIVPAIYLTAIDVARVQGNYAEFDDLLERVTKLPNATDDMIAKAVDRYLKDAQTYRAQQVLERTIEQFPDSPKLLLRLGQLYDEMGQEDVAVRYYDRAARARGRDGAKERREADKAMMLYAPVLTDSERGSFPLALREALGVGLLYLTLAWQDANLDLLQLGPQRWAGVGLALVGGYLLVTATSSPQQRPLGGLLGGVVPRQPDTTRSNGSGGPRIDATDLPIIPMILRVLFGGVGLVLLVLAFVLVFRGSIPLLSDPIPPPAPGL